VVYIDNYDKQFEIEKFHLNGIKLFVSEQLEKEFKVRLNKRNDLVATRKDMYENTIHSSYDFDKLSDAVQYLSLLEVQTNDYKSVDARINKYEKMLK
jgi:DNA helicase-2/ATP-dependent DNA helicase PcrA